MTPEEKDIYRSAEMLISQHGEDALFQADQQYMAMSKKGDQRGLEIWKQIKAAIIDLQNLTPRKKH